MAKMIMGLVILGWFAVQDIRRQSLVVWQLMAAAILSGILAVCAGTEWKEIVAGMAVGGVIYVIACGSREQIGKGDAILLMITGGLWGIRGNIELLLIALLLASIYAGWLLAVRRAGRKKRFAFVPFLALAQLLQVVMQLFVKVS